MMFCKFPFHYTLFLWTITCWIGIYSERYDNCKVVVHVARSSYHKVLKQCFPIEPGVQWFGAGGDNYTNIWPLIMDTERPEEPLLPGGSSGNINKVLNRFWITSEGVSIKVDDDVPIFTKIEIDKSLNIYSFCLISEYKYPYVKLNDRQDEPQKLSYTICQGHNLKHIFQNTVSQSFEKPNGIPLEAMFRTPIWSSPPLVNKNSTHDLLDFVNQATIFMKGANDQGLILIGHEWQGCSGDFRFYTPVVPDPTELVESLKHLNFRVALTVTPFFGLTCLTNDTQESHKKKFYFIRDSQSRPMFIEWNGKNNTLVDFTSDEAAVWWKKRLIAVKEELPGVDSFLFDEGLTSYLPEGHAELNASAEMQPSAFVTSYLSVAASFRNDIMVGSGYLSQQYPLFVKMHEVSNDWAGLRTIVARALQMGILGYPMIIPPAPKCLPNTKLFVRWLQVNALMPAFHLQLVDWRYDKKAQNIVQNLFNIREKYLAEIIDSAVIFSAEGTPIVRPLWWLAPTDQNVHTYKDQFALGDNIIVAPILNENDTRDIYLPEGKWFDESKKKTYEAPAEIFNYYAPMEELPIFTRVTE